MCGADAWRNLTVLYLFYILLFIVTNHALNRPMFGQRRPRIVQHFLRILQQAQEHVGGHLAAEASQEAGR